VVREAKAALDEANIKIPYPQRELLGREEAGGFQLGREEVDPGRPTASRVDRSNGQ